MRSISSSTPSYLAMSGRLLEWKRRYAASPMGSAAQLSATRML